MNLFGYEYVIFHSNESYILYMSLEGENTQFQ